MTTTPLLVDIAPQLERLIRRESLAPSDCEAVMEAIAAGSVSREQAASFLVLLRSKGETYHEIAALARVMRSKAIHTHLHCADEVVDIVGTGGDGHDTVNVSTTAAIVAAACGVKIAKHGNKAATSKSGAADVLLALNVPLLSPASIDECIRQCGVAFLFAPHFHPAMKEIGPIRKAVGVRTIFNILGPLINPAHPRRMVLGVYSKDLLEKYARASQELGCEHVLVAHCGGLDELATVDVSHVCEVRGGREDEPIQVSTLDPKTLPGCTSAYCEIADLKGGDAVHNARIIRTLLGGKAHPEFHSLHRGILETVAMNAGAAVYVGGLEPTLGKGFARAVAAIESGIALQKLDEWIRVAGALKALEEVTTSDDVKRTKTG